MEGYPRQREGGFDRRHGQGKGRRLAHRTCSGEGRFIRETDPHRAVGPGLITPVTGARREGGVSFATQKPHVARWLGMQLPAGVAGPPPIEFELQSQEIKLVQGLRQDIR